MDEKIKSDIRGLRDRCNVAYVGSVNGDGFPQIKAMLVAEHDDMRVQYFSTNLSSKRAAQFKATLRRACTIAMNASLRARCLPELLRSAPITIPSL